MTPLTHDRLRMIVFNVLNPAWPNGLHVYVPSEEYIASTLADQLLQAHLGGLNAIQQLTLNDKPDSLRALQTQLANHTDNGQLEVAVQSLLYDGTLLFRTTGSELRSHQGQRLIGYVVLVNRDI